MELVSIIIPAYNAAAFIADALASAQTQTYQDLEIIVIDDGSTDDTAAIVEAIAARDSRVCLLRQPNQGVASARNLAIRNSRGAFVAPLDADDLWHPDKIARQVQVMSERGKMVGMVYAWSSLIDEEGRIISERGIAPLLDGNIFPCLIIRNLIGNGSVPLLRRDYLLEAGSYDPSLRTRGCEGSEDLMLYLTIAARYDVALVPAFLVGYRRRASNMSNNMNQMKRSRDLVIQTMRARHPELPSRVFRWAKALNCWHAGGGLHRDEPLTAIGLFARTFAYDPAFLFEPQLWKSVRRVATQLLKRTELMNSAAPRVDFLEACARLDWHGGLPTRVFSARRHAFLTSQAYAARGSTAAKGTEPQEGSHPVRTPAGRPGPN